MQWCNVRLVGLLILGNHANGPENNMQVQFEGPVAKVVQVIVDTALHLVQRICLTAKTVNLGPPGNAGFDLVPHHVALY